MPTGEAGTAAPSQRIPANLAVGSGRHPDQDFARFVVFAMGSASQLEYHLLLARELGFLKASTHAALDERTTEVNRMVASLLVGLRADH